VPRDAAWEERVKTEVEKLGRTLILALAEDEQTIGSPVYSTVEGFRVGRDAAVLDSSRSA
jgi:hypothetical protein